MADSTPAFHEDAFRRMLAAVRRTQRSEPRAGTAAAELPETGLDATQQRSAARVLQEQRGVQLQQSQTSESQQRSVDGARRPEAHSQGGVSPMPRSAASPPSSAGDAALAAQRRDDHQAYRPSTRAADQEAASATRQRFQQLAGIGRRFGGEVSERVFGSAGEVLQRVLGRYGLRGIFGLLLIPPLFTPVISPQTFLFRPFLLFAVDAYWWSASHSSLLRPLAMWEKVIVAVAHLFYLIDLLVLGVILYTLTHPCYLLDFVDLGVFNFLRDLMQSACSPELIEKFLKVAT